METKLFVVEDEPAIQEVIRSYALELGYQIESITNSFETAIARMEGSEANFALLDIRLGEEKDGILVARQVKEKLKIPFIFITSLSDSETLLKASLEFPDGYLLKPFTREDLFATVELIKHKRRFTSSNGSSEAVKSSLFIKADYAHQKVNFCDILFVNAEGNYVKINLANGKNIMARATMKEFVGELPSDIFFQVHKSYIVNTNHITSITGNSVLINNSEIPLSATCKAAFFEKLNIQ
jgi:DNA-binding LytR/AlgR family response regulator